ncbi:MAG: glycosyltransferase [Candidatus Brocadiia bacterium]
MNIAMFTNTYLPHVGGVANSVSQFTEGYRQREHRVLVVAPDYGRQPENERDVVRLAAVKNVKGSDFAAALPLTLELDARLDAFDADIFHAHHPYLIGDSALRGAAARQVPLVFTHHTMYEHYTQYIPLDLPGLKPFIVELATGYANLCDRVIAPSESVRDTLRKRGVETPISVIPTGVEIDKFGSGDGRQARERHGVPEDAFVVGHVGRLAPEKNLPFLARAAATFLEGGADAHALFVGDGPAVETIREAFAEHGVEERLHLTGTLKGQELVDAYHAMDVFAFASRTETQGMVLVEALAAGCPLVAIDAPGAREVVQDGQNGRLLAQEDEGAFADAIDWVAQMDAQEREDLRRRAAESARPFSMDRCVERALNLYEEVLASGGRERKLNTSGWDAILESLKREWDLWANRISAVSEAVQHAEEEPAEEETE